MLDEMQSLYFDDPIKYKELQIYPVTMRDYLEFHWLVNCLLVDKNSIPDIEIISMTYLRFLYFMAESEELPYIYMIKKLLCMVLHYDFNEEIKFYVNDRNQAFFKIKDIEYNSVDFDNIASIIMKQNCIKPIDETIQKEIRDALNKAEEYRMQQNHRKMCSLEEQMICVLISTSLKLEDIYALTIRKFEKILERVDAKMHYEIYLSASMSGFVSFKDKDAIKHWMSDLTKEDEYEDVKVDMDAMHKKIDGANQ